MATIKGVWKFNDTLVRDTNVIGNYYSLNFTGVEGLSGNFNRIRFSQYANTMNYPTSYYGIKMEFRYVGETSYRSIYESNRTPQWTYSTQTVDFGESEQTVSDTFYSWLTANAVRLFSEYSVKRETLTAIADSIRAKTGGSNPILTEDMASEIEGIETGITPTGTLEITENGTYDVTEKAQVNVAVPLPPKWDKTVVFEALKSGYTVTVLLYTSMGWSEGANFEYSTDGGTAWTPVSLQYDTPFVIDVEEGGQFRYRVSPVNGVLWVDEGDAIIHSGYGTYTSPNKTLTANLEINIDTGD